MEYNVNIFKRLLWNENEKQNLISRKSSFEEIDKHLEDSLRVLEFIDFNNKKVVDIGSGAGFPGLILAIYEPNLQMTLLEADQKKSQFLRRVKDELRLNNVEVVNRRVEEAGQDRDFRENFDLCTARAVAAMNVLLEYGMPFLKVDGKLLLWKGRNYNEEICQAGNALQLLDAEVEEVFYYTLMEDLDRVIVAIKKGAPARINTRAG
ncbi:16S rRNA (guanine(527)-N(7))-methyltransferase RsmG [Syntrophomonas palmitatica]|uniref:16S rRNA (guanine(527)-N(7))-methyltransferase RsmG n=1 Tax=Syntrophomonas palmitatica TaxID=402877 RepID=UPI0006D1632B|nr:16S rRNA (guanine(527)-N(7))-methyltransferase RsmG [Syntrophomonas palmitatica]